MKRIVGILFALLILQPVLPHYKARYHVIIDTDGGPDDIRTICLMLASPEIEVITITTVEGFLSTGETAGWIKELLARFGHEGIPVGTNAGEDIPEAIELEEMPVDIIALGPLTNLAKVLEQNPGIPDRVRKVYWHNDASDKKDFNFAHYQRSAKRVLNSALALDRIHAGENLPGFMESLVAGLDTLTTRYAKAIWELYQDLPPGFMDQPSATGLVGDCIPLYLLYPENFTVAITGEEPLRRTVIGKKDADLLPLLIGILNSELEDKSIIFSRFPADPGLFEEDVAAIATEIIHRHGLKEWKIVVLTNEFHEHLGIYSILGAKMGLRAREYFHVGIDELRIESFAGSQPPVSCLNDGLQVSTGGTLGHGTITLSEGEVIPKARFAFKGRIIELNIREDIRQQIKKDVGYGVQTYGLDSPEYWAYIRKLALGYWFSLSRFEIFNIMEIPVH
jgi:pyrimidine-specific ribonucleoside hydrolase